MAYSAFGDAFASMFKESWKAAEDREKEKRIARRARKAKQDELWGKLMGASPEALERLASERDIVIPEGEALLADPYKQTQLQQGIPVKRDPMAAIKASTKGLKGRERRREMAGQTAALSRIAKDIEAEKSEERYERRSVRADDRALATWKKKLNITDEIERGKTHEQRIISAASAAGATDMVEWDSFTIENDLDSTRDSTNPVWMAFNAANMATSKKEGAAKEKIQRDAVHDYLFRVGQTGGKPPAWMLSRYPVSGGMLYKSGQEQTKIAEKTMERGVSGAVDQAEQLAKLADKRWLEGGEADRLRVVFSDLWKRPEGPEGGVRVPHRKPYNKALAQMVERGYAVKKGPTGEVVPTDRWLNMYKKDPKKFDLYARYVEMTGKLPTIGTTDSKLTTELNDIASSLSRDVIGVTTNALKAGGGLNEVVKDVDLLIAEGRVKPDRRDAVIGMAMKEITAQQFTQAVGENERITSYRALAKEVGFRMSSEEEVKKGEPRWIIVMTQDTDEEGNPILVGTYHKHPQYKLTYDDIKAIDVKLNDVGAVGKSGVPTVFVDPVTGKSSTIQRIEDPLKKVSPEE